MTKKELREKVFKVNRNLTAFDKADMIKSLFPEMCDEIISDADQYLQSMFILPGTDNKPHFVGTPIEWDVNPTGDNEYLFHLNRMAELKTLAEAFSLTRDERYAKKACDELVGWALRVKRTEMKDEEGNYHPERFDGPTSGPWRALEVGIRMYRTVPIILEQLAYSDSMTEKDLEIILKCISEHMEVLYTISPLLWPDANHNHYLMECLGLYTAALMFPELDPDGKYSKHAKRELKRCMKAQCTAEGAQIEGCPSYHNGCVYWFSLKNNVEMRYGYSVDEEYTAKLDDMFTHSLYATRNLGTNIPWGDSHTFPVETCSVAAVGLYLATGDIEPLKNAIYYVGAETVKNDLKFNLFRIVDLERAKEDIVEAINNPKEPELPLLHFAKDVNQVYIKGGWNKDDFTFMTGCRTPVYNLHAHIDPTTFDYSFAGETLIADPGIFTYKTGDIRHRFKSSAFHSMLTINKEDAWEYQGSWKYGEQKEGKIISVKSFADHTEIVEQHHNYSPAVVTRVFYIEKDAITVLDIAEGMKDDDKAYISFHVDSPTVSVIDNRHVSSKKEGNAEIDIYSATSQTLELESGLISDRTEVSRESTLVRFIQSPIDGKVVSASLLLPRRKEEKNKAASIECSVKNNSIAIKRTIENEEKEYTYSI